MTIHKLVWAQGQSEWRDLQPIVEVTEAKVQGWRPLLVRRCACDRSSHLLLMIYGLSGLRVLLLQLGAICAGLALCNWALPANAKPCCSCCSCGSGSSAASQVRQEQRPSRSESVSLRAYCRRISSLADLLLAACSRLGLKLAKVKIPVLQRFHGLQTNTV